MKYYAVKNGRKVGIYNTWEEAFENINGYKGAIYKSFSNYEDAQSFLNDEIKIESDNSTYAYIDGSYDKNTGNYSFGAVLVSNGNCQSFKKMFLKDEFSVHHNVAGEIKGAGFIINYCINHNIKELDLYYDYEGIEKWYLGIWKATKPISQIYQKFAQEAKDKISVNFIKVKSHSNVYYNEIVDKLAKEALGIS